MQNQQDITSFQDSQPLVSFIITYYQLPVQMLCECIDSILALPLSKTEREIILVDDGSNESPIGQLQKYQDDIIYVRQANTGLSGARNRGILTSSGQYLQFVDADDYLIREPYKHCLDIARHKKPDIVLFDFTDGTDDNESSVLSMDHQKSGTEYLFQHNLQATACCYLLRKNILGGLRFTPGIYHEDEEFTPQLLLRADTVISTDAQAYFYRKRPYSITTQTDKRTVVKRLNDKLLVINKLNRIADTLPNNERIALGRRVAQLTMDYLYNIIMQTRNRHYLERKVEQLRKEGLFPLPDRGYTVKYKWFRRMTNSSAGRTVLMRILPLLNKER